MNTPSHFVLNLVLLGRVAAPSANGAIALGAILPDVPIFVFYAAAKLRGLPESEIWSTAYYEPFWQTLVAIGHSLPLALLGLMTSRAYGWHAGTFVCLSLICHSLLDLPVHNSDAHRHFFPLNDYRFISPVSYWDPNHYGHIAAPVELLLVLAATPFFFALTRSLPVQGIVIAIDLLYVFGYCRFYLLAPSGN
ncbi:hypothetical protein KR51_00018690 [Rubidibacter lacunae KORDI 51-2]|uniref:Membrane-bound metal-dependent hydrolase (DUF457) n=1 Tax=Rubidibacter lacunae KORDI 51-2 TaxID=582515 RepID=U5DIZ0_9CHRO|nr:hypothetical protein [Rubidibacter lacunae]ERN41641.1 hypothetical protein KR51_00018690 [Rubidibacter lacunae KORDI 51-2]